eukprot:6204414-Pleurochrysis_carterae.AAC.1
MEVGVRRSKERGSGWYQEGRWSRGHECGHEDEARRRASERPPWQKVEQSKGAGENEGEDGGGKTPSEKTPRHRTMRIEKGKLDGRTISRTCMTSATIGYDQMPRGRARWPFPRCVPCKLEGAN